MSPAFLPLDRKGVKSFLILIADIGADLKEIRRVLGDGEEEEAVD